MDGGIRVIHVDDDPSFTEVTARFLRSESERFDIVTETRADAALEALRDGSSDVDCLVSDYALPGMDGIELLETVREEFPDLPFILFTGRGSEAVASEALAGGATDYLQKQSGTEQYALLANKIENAVERYRTERRAATLERIRALVRDINQALVRASSQAEIETEVCELIAASDAYLTACVAGVDEETMRIEPRTWAGAEQDYFADLEMRVDEGSPGRRSPGGQAFHERELAVSKNVQEDPRYEKWSEAAAARGFRSLAVVPLEHEDDLYGLLAVFSARRDAFDETEREFLTELGADVGHALHGQAVEAELQRQTQEFDTVFEHVPAGIILMDHEDGTFRYRQCNARMEELSGLSAADIRGRTPSEVLGPEDAAAVEAEYRTCVERGEPVEYTAAFEIDGEQVVRHGTVVPVSEAGAVEQLVVVVSDITEQRGRERSLSAYEAAIETVPDGVYILDEDFEFTMVNEAMTALTGYDREDLIGSHASLVFDEETLEEGRRNRERLQASDDEYERLETALRTASGETRPCEVRGRLLTDAETEALYGTAGVVRDISQREREERRRVEIIERVTDAIVEVDSEWRFTLVNEQAEELYDMTEAELLGRHFWDVFEGALGTRFEEVYRGVMASREPDSLVEYYPGLDGWFDIQVYPTEDGGVAFYFQDITDHKEQERELELAKARYQALAENFPNGGVFYFDEDLRYQIVAGRGFEPIETAPEELRGNTIYEVEAYSQPTVETLEEIMEATLAGASESHELSYEGRVYDLRTAPVRDEDGEVVAGLYITQDVTERVQYQSELERTNERLEEFASVVSHDLRSPLNIVEGRLELARQDRDSEHLEEAALALDRATELIEDLLTLAREGTAVDALTAVPLEDVVEGCWRTVETADATLVVDTSQTIRADRSRLKQLFENLFRNGVEHAGSDVRITVGDLADGFYVEDDGPGIPEDRRDEVFQSAYSTVSGNTGFGLAIVKDITEAHGWDVAVTTGADGGARFEFTGVETP